MPSATVAGGSFGSGAASKVRASAGAKTAAKGVLRRSGSGGLAPKAAARKPVTTRHVRALLPGLFRHTQGKPFKAQMLRSWLQKRLAKNHFKLPSAAETERLLQGLVRTKRDSACDASAPLGAWQPVGVRYQDPEGTASIDNLHGFVQGPRGTASTWVAWNEYGLVYRLQRKGDGPRASFEVCRSHAFKRLSMAVQRRTLAAVTEDGDQAEFKSSIVFEPRRAGVGRVAPTHTFIYLHSFSNRGVDYEDFPHYFGLSGASIRVVLPTAPQQEQTCFKDWMVWRGEKLKWRRIKFNSWFDYLTDKGGRAENDLEIQSLLEMRERLHAIIRSEVQRVGGDPRRVILGGASQGCCVALDAALTYPEELGGVIGLVGHVLGSTPLDPSKRSMPLHLFHEATDQEMNWRWVKGTVQRLVDAGFNVTSKREADPTGSGHWIQEIEGQWIRQALRRIVHGTTGL